MKNAYTFSARLSMPIGVCAFLPMFAFAIVSSADEPKQDSPTIAGVWRLHGRIGDDGEVEERMGEEAEVLFLKIISDGRWCITYADSTGAVRSHHGGTYTLHGSRYTETVEYATGAARTLVNKAFEFDVEVEGDTLVQEGIGNPYNEVWKRVMRRLDQLEKGVSRVEEVILPATSGPDKHGILRDATGRPVGVWGIDGPLFEPEQPR